MCLCKSTLCGTLWLHSQNKCHHGQWLLKHKATTLDNRSVSYWNSIQVAGPMVLIQWDPPMLQCILEIRNLYRFSLPINRCYIAGQHTVKTVRNPSSRVHLRLGYSAIVSVPWLSWDYCIPMGRVSSDDQLLNVCYVEPRILDHDCRGYIMWLNSVTPWLASRAILIAICVASDRHDRSRSLSICSSLWGWEC